MRRLATVKSCYVVAALAAYFTLFLNGAFFLKIYGYLFSLDDYSIAFALTIPVLVFCFLYVVISFLVLPGFTKIFWVPFLPIFAAEAYASVKYGVMWDSGMIQNAMETNYAETSSYFSLSSIAFVISLGVLPALALASIKIEYHEWWKEILTRIALVAGATTVMVAVALGFYDNYAPVARNNLGSQKYIVPTGPIYGIGKYVWRNYLQDPIRYVKVGEDAHQVRSQAEKPSLVVVVIGETDRAINHHYNNYERDTDFYTEQVGMESLGIVSSCGTATAVSLPCMFSLETRSNFNGQLARHQDNVLDILQRAGVKVVWVDNDSGCKGVCVRVGHVEIDAEAASPYCNGKTCIDEIMLEQLDNLLASDNGRDALLVFHLIGSHGPTYYQRYPDEFRYFKPDCPRSDIQNCSPEELKNTYDNSVRHTSYVVAQMVKRLERVEDRYQAGLIYISDHGESLGEKGIFLHGLPYGIAPAEQTHVPELVWFSGNYAHSHGIDNTCLRHSTPGKPLSQDYLFHSLLGLMDIQTKAYQPELDIAGTCRHLHNNIAVLPDRAALVETEKHKS